MTMTAEQAWQLYKRHGDPAAREWLITNYFHLIHVVLERMNVPYNAMMQYSDAVGYGVIGLIDAIEKFDPSRKVKFETYAYTRIRGAILDSVRSLQWERRSVMEKTTKLSRTVEALESARGRPPTDEEIAAALGMDGAQYAQFLADTAPVTLLSLEEVLFQTDDGETVALEDMLPDHDSEEPLAHVEREEMIRILREAIDALPEREKLVITLYYYEELTLKEIAHVLSVSDVRVSQLHTQALARLRARLHPLGEAMGIEVSPPQGGESREHRQSRTARRSAPAARGHQKPDTAVTSPASAVYREAEDGAPPSVSTTA